MIKRFGALPGLMAGIFVWLSPAHSQNLVSDDLITGSNQTTPWQVCDTDSLAVDVTALDAGGCAYRTTPAVAGVTYRMSCGITVAKYSSITLAFLDAEDNTLASRITEVTEHVSGAYSVTLDAPARTVTAAIGIYGEPGSGFQDCVLIDATPAPEPTKGSISGLTWFDASSDNLFDDVESAVSGSPVSLFSNGALLNQTETDIEGNYYFGNLDIDTCYVVSFGAADTTLQLGANGGDNDAMANGETNEVCLTEASSDITDVDAAFITVPPVVPPADNTICGVAWVDANENGIFDGTDSTLRNIRVRLFDAEGKRIDSERTDANGNYVFYKLANGDYQVKFSTPDGHEPTTASGQPLAGSSIINEEGRTTLFNLPGSSNTSADSACTIQHVNGGFIKLPVALDPTIATDDSVIYDVGTDFNIDFLANDLPCDGVHEVNILGHNVPGQVSYDAQSNQFIVTGTTTNGIFSIDYGLRGSCGSYDTATVLVELSEVPPPVASTAPDAPICRVETGGSTTIGGVDVFNPDSDGFASNYNFYDRDKKLVITVDSSDYTHKYLIGNDANQWEGPFIGNWEIEWNGTTFGYDQVSIYYASAVENGEESEFTECVRTLISPIALDLSNQGRIQRVAGDFSVDLDGDGVKEKLSQWFAPSAGILVTANASGQIDGRQLFGNVPGVYSDGFAELATLDADNNGQLIGDELSTLAIWTDTDSDTVVDPGELSSLAHHQFVALSVTHYKYMSRATKEDGRSVLMEDVWLPLAIMAAQTQ